MVCGYFVYSFVSTEIQLIQLNDQKNSLQGQLAAEQDKSEQLDQELDLLHSDDYIETLARKYFGLVYPQEKVIIEVEPNSKNN
nr:septum formation initiator family protein [Alkalibacter mobilis]